MNKLAVRIAEKGLKKSKIAERAGIAKSTLSKILSGESTPTLLVALRIAAVLETTVEDLWGHLNEKGDDEL